MKRLLVAFMSVLLLISLTACGDDSPEPYQVDILESDMSSDETKKDENDEKEKVSDKEFDNGDFIYKIKEVEQIKGNVKEDNEDVDLLAVEVEFTNNTSELVEPFSAEGISAYQETDETVDYLEILDPELGLYPEDYKPDLVKVSNSDVKPKKTVDTVIIFEINTLGNDVILKDSGDFPTNYDGEFFELTVETEK